MPTGDHHRLRIAAIAAAKLTVVAGDLERLLAVMHDNEAGYPPSGGGSTRGGATSDPTGEAATSHDPVKADLAELDRLLLVTDDATQDLDAIRHRYLTVVGTVGGDDPEGCALHWTQRDWKPIHRRTTAGGIFDQPKPLCRPCYDFIARWGRVPTRKELAHAIRTSKFPRAVA